jgi:transglutaminase-like putative cysteine protease
MIRKTAIIMLLCAAAWAQPKQRHFTFTYKFHVNDVPLGAPLRVWAPLASSDAFQTVRVAGMKGDLPLTQTREAEYGNRMVYAETPKATRSRYDFEITYDVVRRERVVDLSRASMTAPNARGNAFAASGTPEGAPSKAALARFLRPDTLVPITGQPAEWAAQETSGKTNDLDKAQALYEFVYRTMKYDKSGTGWGRGDVLYACDAKKGNCTDFHSLFISMARSQGIPARFEIGFSIPADKHQGEVVGYHCWADFYLRDRGWVPVDISEAWKHPEKHDYFFGAHDVDRVQFSLGRDVQLAPPQSGAPVNYFLFPYAEAGGKVRGNVVSEISFADAQ